MKVRRPAAEWVRFLLWTASFLVVSLLSVTAGWAADDGAAIRDAAAAIERGDYVLAEQKLRVEVAARPRDALALSLLGTALDHQKRFREAEELHRRATASAPGSAEVLSNYGNHLLGAGDEKGAREAYLRVVALEPAHYNANVQLSRLALAQKDGQEALRCLNRLPPDQREAPRVAILRLQALSLTGDRAGADALAARLSAAAEGDAASSYSLGMGLAKAGFYDKAEVVLTRALAAAPADFGLLYNLGVAASFAGHHERAREVLEAALRLQPRNVDVLYSLAYENAALRQRESAVRLLAQAAQLAPKRADIQKLLAITTGDLGALADSLAAWDRYLKLEPNDEFARRERGFAAAKTGQFEEGIADLQWFLARHPSDDIGHYELAMAQIESDPAQALIHLDKALALKPDFADALSARGSLSYQQGKPEAAVTDLEAAAVLRPADAVTLDKLGQTYLALDRPENSVRVLRKAAELAPDDSKIQLHFGRALADAGQPAESKVAMDRFRQLGPEKKGGVPAGLVAYLSLTPEQQRADYRARVEKAVASDPGDAAVQLRYLQLLLDDGSPEQAAATARRIASLKPAAGILASAGRALLESRQYDVAIELLDQAAAGNPSTDVQLDAAIAAFHSAGAVAGLQRLDQVPESGRNGDYHLARAQMLDAAGRPQEAASALEQAAHAAPKRLDLYQQAAVLLARNGQAPEALRLLDQAEQTIPRNRDLLLMKATILELARQSTDAERLLNQIQNRWPEWHAGWVARGVILEAHRQFEEARQALETAVALGARSSEVLYYLAECTLHSAPKQIEAADAVIRRAVQLAPEDPWIQSLAGRIALEKRDFATAVDRQREATRLRPSFVQAHSSLAQAYASLGRKQEAQAELEKVKAIQQDSSASGDEPPYAGRLFLEKPPRDW